jgi:hypothetical protein
MIHSHFSSQESLQSRSLIVDDLSAQLAPLDMYGLANVGSAAGDALSALLDASRKGLRALNRAWSTTRSQPTEGPVGGNRKLKESPGRNRSHRRLLARTRR